MAKRLKRFNALNGRELRLLHALGIRANGTVSMPSTGANCDFGRQRRGRCALHGFNALNGRELRRSMIMIATRCRSFQCPQRARIATMGSQGISETTEVSMPSTGANCDVGFVNVTACGIDVSMPSTGASCDFRILRSKNLSAVSMPSTGANCDR